MIRAAEWKKLQPLLPPSGGPGKPRQDDRLYVSAFFYAAATSSSLECLPRAYGNPRSLRTRRLRWERDGTLRRLMQAGEPVVQRMHNRYWGLLRDASISWDNSREFFGRGIIPRKPHTEPRGRYARDSR
jgi:transposase